MFNLNLKRNVMVAYVFASLTTGCLDHSPSVAQLPEVNDENCKHENVLKLPEDMRKKMGSACFRRSKFVPSTSNNW